VVGGRGEGTCVELMNEAFGPFLQSHKPDVIILSARWIEGDVADVERTLRALAGKADRIVVLGPIVEYAMPLPRLLAQVAGGRDPFLLTAARLPEQRGTDGDLAAAVTHAGGRYISLYRLLCAVDGATCRTMVNDIPMQWDYGHLTAEGSELIAEKIKASGALALTGETAK
jgi:hypothetical protein